MCVCVHACVCVCHSAHPSAGWLGHAVLDQSMQYNRGKQAVAEAMQKRHSMVQHRTISLAHGDIVGKQASLGPATFFG